MGAATAAAATAAAAVYVNPRGINHPPHNLRRFHPAVAKFCANQTAPQTGRPPTMAGPKQHNAHAATRLVAFLVLFCVRACYTTLYSRAPLPTQDGWRA